MPTAAPPLKQAVKTAAPPKRKNSLLWFGKIMVWQVVAILIVEFVLAWAGLGEEEMFSLDPELGTKHMANKHITWRSEGFAHSYFDADGMREPGLTIAKPAGTYRIALLGDSMVEALQVPIEKTFGQDLQKELSQSEHRPVQTLNFGTSGYSTAQEYLQLKKQVFKYQPDMVICFYNSRDIFENWSAPDQTITNVRPNALHLPGGHLVIDYSPVIAWRRSARGKFLIAIDWLRHNSRIWGLYSAAQTEWSYASPVYRALCTMLKKPKQGLSDLVAALMPKSTSQPSFSIAKFESTQATTQASATPADSKYDQLNSAAPNRVLRKDIATVAPSKTAISKQAEAGRRNYINLIVRTETSLYDEMRKECERHGAKFMVVTLPSKALLCPLPNMETEFFGINYRQEIQMVADICRNLSIPMFDCEVGAEKLPQKQAGKFFYSMHLTPDGHKFMAQEIYPFVSSHIRN